MPTSGHIGQLNLRDQIDAGIVSCRILTNARTSMSHDGTREGTCKVRFRSDYRKRRATRDCNPLETIESVSLNRHIHLNIIHYSSIDFKLSSFAENQSNIAISIEPARL